MTTCRTGKQRKRWPVTNTTALTTFARPWARFMTCAGSISARMWRKAFFGEEERRLQVMLDRQKILNDESLTDSERDRALAQLDQLLPEYSVELRRRSRTVVETTMQVQQLREQGASEAEVRELRLQAYGAEATERLARLDQQRNQWQNRLGEYRQQKALIDNNEGLAPADRQAAVEALRERIFTEEHERRRIRALERTAGLDS